MVFIRGVLILFISFLCVCGFAFDAAASSSDLDSSFQKLVGDTEWKINLKNFTLSQKKAGNIFELRMGDEKYFGFSAFQGKDEPKNQFGPLSIEYKDSLRELLDYAMVFAGQEKTGQFAMNMNWKMYPQSIKKWAKIWRDSSLREKWDKTEKYTRYKNLTGMISEFLKEDMQPVANAIGFEITGASMEKMGHFKAGKLEFYDKVLKNTGVPENMKIPIPLMLRLLLKPLPESTAVKDTKSDSKGKCQVDSLFVIAKLKSTNVCCTFERVFDEYQISGDTLTEDGKYVEVLPMVNKKYNLIAGKLFQACLKAASAEKKKSIFFCVNLRRHHPIVYRQVIKHFNRSSEPAREIKKSGFSDLKFYEYKPEVESGFQAAVNPFLKQNGYVFSSLEISFTSRQKAGKYPDYEKTFKPLGIKADDKPHVPNVVYMRITLKK